MSHAANNDRVLRVHRELSKILDDPGLIARLPQALLDRLDAMRATLLQELKVSSLADSDRELLSAVPLRSGSKVHERKAAAPAPTVLHSEHAEEDALLRLDDDGGANAIPQRLPM